MESNAEEKKEEKDTLTSEVDSEDSESELIVNLGTPEKNIDCVNIATEVENEETQDSSSDSSDSSDQDSGIESLESSD